MTDIDWNNLSDKITMGFDAVGFELDPDYYAKSKQRLEDFMRQPRIDTIEQQQLEQLML